MVMIMSQEPQRVCPLENAGSLDRVWRKLIQNPKRILGGYVKEGMTVLDIGCGPGFFSKEMAIMVGKTGHVFSSDLQAGMLQRLKSKIQGTKIEGRITLHKSEEDRIGITEHIDFVLAFYMVHEVNNQLAFFREIKSILKPSGLLFVIEPIFHVSKEAFENTIKNAKESGFTPHKEKKVFLSRAIILK
jgi:ubiquinone/menaquinone biosynthesis C-methylase UbiE